MSTPTEFSIFKLSNKKRKYRRFYEKLAIEKDTALSFYQSYPSSRLLEEVINIVTKRYYLNIADVGCGDGILLEKIQQNYREHRKKSPLLVGVDISKVRLERTKKRARAKTYNADIEDLPFRNNQFELVICTEVLEHIPHYRKGLSELARITKDKGTLVVSVPTVSWLRLIAAKLGRRINLLSKTEHLREYTYFALPRFVKIRDFINELKKLNLKIKEVKGTYFYTQLMDKILTCLYKRSHWSTDILTFFDKIIGKIPFLKYFGRYLIIEVTK